jgi:hypothetical protein
MTAVRVVWVSCDPGDGGIGSEDCWEQTGDGSIMGQTHETVTAARDHARADGWHARPGGRDVCGPCWDKGLR